MKRIIAFLTAAAIVISFAMIPASALSSTDMATSVKFFYNDTNGIAYKNGTYVKLYYPGVVAVSTDFKTWENIDLGGTRDYADLFVIGDNFVVVSGGKSFVSQDGKNYTAYDNSLTGFSSYTAQTSKGIVVFYTDNTTGGNYFSADGIHFTKSNGAPDGGRLYSCNGKFVVESENYEKGIYVSDDGLNFKKVLSDGVSLSFYGGKYHAVKTEADGSLTIYSSGDLSSFDSRKGEAGELYPKNAAFITENGTLSAYDADGAKFSYIGGKWTSVESVIKDMKDNGKISFTAFSDGLIAYNRGFCNRSFVLKNDGTFIRDLRGLAVRFMLYSRSENKFYYYNHVSGSTPMTYSTTDGVTFDYLPFGTALPAPESPLTGTNGKVTLTSPMLDRGQAIGSLKNEDIMVTASDSSLITYENSKANYVEFQSGDGFFVIRNNTLDDNFNYYYSKDGVVRYPILIDGKAPTGPIIVGKDHVIMTGLGNRFYSIPSEKFKELCEYNFNQKIMLNGEYLSFDVTPANENNSLLIPLRFLFERAGATVGWNGGTSTATVTLDGLSVSVTKNSSTALVNGKEVPLNVPARLIDGKTMVPLRFISENLGFDVKWDAATSTAKINTK